MKVQYILYFLLFTSLLNFISLEYTIIDKAPPSLNFYYGDSVDGCNGHFIFEIYDTNSNGFESVLAGPTFQSYQPMNYYQNNSYWIGSIYFHSIPYGENQIKIMVTDLGSVSTVLNFINFSCDPIPYPLEISNFNDEFFCSNYLLDMCVTTFNINLVKNTYIEVVTEPPYYCKISILYGNLRTLSCSLRTNFCSLEVAPSINVTLRDSLGRTTALPLIPTFVKNTSEIPDFNYIFDPPVVYAGSSLNVLYSLKYNEKAQSTSDCNLAISIPIGGNPLIQVNYFFLTYISYINTPYQTSLIYFDNLNKKTIFNKTYTATQSLNPPTTTFSSTFADNININSSGYYVYGLDSNYYTNLSESSFEYGNTYTYQYSWPYGLISGNYQENSLKYSLILPEYKKDLGFTFETSYPTSFTQTDTIAPNIELIEFVKLSPSQVVVRIKASDTESGVYSVVGEFDMTQFDYSVEIEDIVDGTVNNPTYEKVLSYDGSKIAQLDTTYKVFDFVGNKKYYDFGYIGPNPIPRNPVQSFIKGSFYLNETKLTELRWKIYYLDASVVGCNNTLYLNYENSNPDDIVTLQSLFSVADVEYTQCIWDTTFNSFACELFFTPALISDQFIYYIQTPYFQSISSPLIKHLGSNAMFKLYSAWGDFTPPLVESVSLNASTTSLKWELVIVDDFIGFESGLIKVTSNIDGISYDFILTSQGKVKTKDTYTIELQLDTQYCVPQTFTLSYVNLTDGRYSNLESSEYILAFAKLPAAQRALLSYSHDCPDPVIDVDPPALSSLEISMEGTSIDVGSLDRRVLIYFQVTDSQSPISKRQTPVCYFTGKAFRTFKVIAEYEGISQPSSNTSVNWFCDAELPYGFGDGVENLLLSIHGYSDVYLNYGGVSIQEISNLSFEYQIPTKYTRLQPIIHSTSTFTSRGGYLLIFGHSLTSQQSSTVKIQTGNGTILFNSITPSISTTVALRVENLPKNLDTILVTVINDKEVVSNTFEVKVLQLADDGSIAPLIPTNSPQPPSCPGNCNENGVCGTRGCLCKNPWFGDDCLSQIINITPPKANETNPTIDTPYELLKSLVSIVSLNEMRLDNAQPIKSFIFNQWIYKNTTTELGDDNILEYTYSTKVYTTCLVTVTIRYYKQSQVIYFANEKLDMPATSFKYNIEIKKYPFASPINYLQLVMSASLENSDSNSSEESCSIVKSGTTSDQTESDYFKIQVNKNSLYGRFIKRAIVDNRIMKVSNQILTRLDSTNSYQNVLIGINIPTFVQNANIDPDFSVLIDHKSASEIENSICKTSSDESKKNSLSKTQIAGIVIGVVGFVAVVIISICYAIYKKKQYLKMAAKIQKLSDNINK